MLKFVELSMLYDFYGPLLTMKQQKSFELYYYDDLSLGEISDQLNITRQAVHDNLKRAQKLLNQYEDKLKLVEKYNRKQCTIKNILDEINNYERSMEHNNNNKLLNVAMDRIKILLKELQKD